MQNPGVCINAHENHVFTICIVAYMGGEPDEDLCELLYMSIFTLV